MEVKYKSHKTGKVFKAKATAPLLSPERNLYPPGHKNYTVTVGMFQGPRESSVK